MAELSRGQILKDPEVLGTSTSGAKIRLQDGDESAYIDLKAPDTVTASYTLTLPPDDGTNGQLLQTNGSGTTTWATITSSPGGSDTYIQFNDGGSFGGDIDLTWNKTDNLLDIAGNLRLKAQGDLRFADSDSSNYVAFQAPATVTADRTYTLPDAIGTVGQVLKIATGATSTAATLEWSDDLLGSSNNPGGADTNIQFNDGGTFGGDVDLTYNKTTNILSVTGGINVATGGDYKINNTSVLTSTTLGSGVTTSSLTSVGTLGSLQVDNINVNGNVISSTDTNGNIDLDPNGTGFVRILGDAPLRLMDADNSNFAAISAPTSVTSDYTITLPAAGGALNEVLQFDASQNASFVSNTKTLNFVMSGSGTALSTGVKGYAVLDADYTLTAWTLIGDVLGASTVTVGRAAAPTYPATSAIVYSNIITASTTATQEAAQTTGLTTTMTAGDVLEFNLTANGGLHTNITIALRLVPR